MFRKLLIANRGEIACRVIRTAQKMGVSTVAVHSDVEAQALHVRSADEAVAIGSAAPTESYLRIDAILDAAKKTGAEAIHPGYGFLSENKEFREACDAAGLIFVGPAANAIDRMGDKQNAKDAMRAAGVPLVPGSDGLCGTLAEATDAASRVGYPVMIKAAKGGGGIGMKAVDSDAEMASAYEEATGRAARAFGDGSVYVEKFVRNPHHIEVQVFGTPSGARHVFERECSVQRRHQKVIEEAHAPLLRNQPQTREKLLKAAIAGADAIAYRNAGTMEFLADPEGNFYFLEMNTRLQVEHPVTEMITGLDLVELQLLTAAGEDVSPVLDKITTNGHAIEIRVYAENPKNFFPAPGQITRLKWPEGVRVDTGFEEGSMVTQFYDPMIAKIIAHGEDRPAALAKMKKALQELVLEGPKTNVPFLLEVFEHKGFIDGDYDTNLVYDLRPALKAKK